MAKEFLLPTIRTIDGTESRLTPASSEITKKESVAWSNLFEAVSGLDSRLSRQMGPENIPIEIGFPVELDTLPDDFCSVTVSSIFIDPLLHTPEQLIVTLSLNEENYMRGFCRTTSDKNRVKPEKVQYHFTNGHTKEDFISVLELASDTIDRMHVDLPKKRLN